MIRLVRLSKPAHQDLEEATRWYDAIRPGLGDAFLVQVEAAVGFLSRHLESAPCCVGPVRRKLTRQFPYAIYYRLAIASIDILGVRPTASDLADRYAPAIGKL